MKQFGGFEKEFLNYINSNYDNFTERDVKRLLRNFANKVIGTFLDTIAVHIENQGAGVLNQ